ncbi:FtsB family cell division protein [Prauserella cavernicola]|uniref:Septum formation initiator family protein n=1 Tax=Prauserella cavernicola TaxID=2800127 RepID=A0A934QSS2_9PSEU|nr:septum formation initiator family protein [Prauserella cavernicola]MBK1785568.1 septum formation initiator family protein [Prauserella cavernicola]
MAERGRTRGRRGGGRAQSSSPRRPQRARRDDRKSSLRRGLTAKRTSGAAKVLGMSTTRRAAVVAIVVCALAFTLAVPLRTYLSQRAEVAAEETRQAELKQQVAELEDRKAELSDPAQVEAEARKRLRYVMPGETPYMVQLPEDKAAAQRPDEDEKAPAQAGAWYEMLWDSVTKGE